MVVGLPDEAIAERLDREEPGWKISGKYVGWILSLRVGSLMDDVFWQAVVLLSEGRPGETVRFA